MASFCGIRAGRSTPLTVLLHPVYLGGDDNDVTPELTASNAASRKAIWQIPGTRFKNRISRLAGELVGFGVNGLYLCSLAFSPDSHKSYKLSG